MVHLNMDSDLESAVRKLAADTARPIGTVASALMRLGLLSKPAALRAMIEECARPQGRPPVSAPALGTDLATAKTIPVTTKGMEGWESKLRSGHAQSDRGRTVRPPRRVRKK